MQNRAGFFHVVVSVASALALCAVYATQPARAEAPAGWRFGVTIIVNVGDQESDLAGSHAERTFKVPNPFYFVP